MKCSLVFLFPCLFGEKFRSSGETHPGRSARKSQLNCCQLRDVSQSLSIELLTAAASMEKKGGRKKKHVNAIELQGDVSNSKVCTEVWSP